MISLDSVSRGTPNGYKHLGQQSSSSVYNDYNHLNGGKGPSLPGGGTAPSLDVSPGWDISHMKIRFDPMKQFPSRDAAYYWHADVFDDDGTRYPVRLMIEGAAIMACREPLNDTIVERLYRSTLVRLLAEGRLTPENDKATLTTVFFDQDACQIQPGDIVVHDALEHLTAAMD